MKRATVYAGILWYVSMMNKFAELINIFAYWAEKPLDELMKEAAKKKKKEKKRKLDPKAKVRNRGRVVVPAERALDKKDHLPYNDRDQAANARSRVMQFDKSPPWWKGSLKSLQELTYRKTHSAYKDLGEGKTKPKK